MLSLDLSLLQWAAFVLLMTIGLTEVFGHVPQTWRLFKTKDHSGMSAMSMGVSLCNYLLWSVYYFDKSFWGLLAVNTAATLIYFTLITGAARARMPLGRAALVSSLYLGLALAAFMFAPVTLPVILLGGAAFMFYSAVYVALRSPSVSGVSPATWIGLFLCGAASIGLGTLPGREDTAVALWGAIAVTAASTILVTIAVKSRRVQHAVHALEDAVEDAFESATTAVQEVVASPASFCSPTADQHEDECVCA